MNSENVFRFVLMARDADDLQPQIEQLDGDLPGLVRLAAAHGCVFTERDWMETIANMKIPKELTGEALDQVIGGAVGTATSATPSLGDVSSRFACFPPIGTMIGGSTTRTQGG